MQKEKRLINLKKHSFMKEELIYLGFVVSKEGLKMDLEKIQAIVNWPTPRSIFELRRFHGLASFYQKFIRSFSHICAPIIETIRETYHPLKWTKVADQKFKLLKKKITKKPAFALPNFEKFFQVETDASGIVIGVVLSQDQKPIAYFSEKLNEAKNKYSYYDKEFFAIVQGLKKWRHFLFPKEFVLYSDNHPLQFINNQPKLNKKHAKWVEYLHSFTFVIKHTCGKLNKFANALRRVNLIIQDFQVGVVGFEEMVDMYKDDAKFKEIYAVVENPAVHNRSQWLDYLFQGGLLFKSNKLCIPKCSMRENIIKEKHSGGLIGHFGQDKTISQVNNFYYWPKVKIDVKWFVEKFRICQHAKGKI